MQKSKAIKWDFFLKGSALLSATTTKTEKAVRANIKASKDILMTKKREKGVSSEKRLAIS